MKQLLIIWAFVLMSASAHALNFLPSRGLYNVEVKSYKEQRFGDVVNQQYDFSCGSAAVATLLSYHYQTPSDEESIFTVMYEDGDKALIEREGFSFLDMRNYLEKNGFRSDGYRLGIEDIKEIGVPGITLVNFDGYMHFVLIKGVNDQYVIIGDPSRGTIKMPIEEFSNYYQGIILLVKNYVEIGRKSFVTDNKFAIYTPSPVDSAVSRSSLGIFSTTLPEAGYN